MTREELTKLTVKQLDQMCKENNLPRYKGKTHLNKTEMINNILEKKREKAEEVLNTVEVNQEETYEEHVSKIVNKAVGQQEETLANESLKDNYIQNAKLGSLIAFLDKKKLTRTGKILEINSEKRHITVELKSGKKFYIQFDDVLWVTTDENHRWPKKILYALKESQQKIEEDYKNKINNKDISQESIDKLNARFKVAK